MTWSFHNDLNEELNASSHQGGGEWGVQYIIPLFKIVGVLCRIIHSYWGGNVCPKLLNRCSHIYEHKVPWHDIQYQQCSYQCC